MGKKKTIRHMGMTMTEAEHRRWHQEHEGQRLTATEHQKLMEHLGVRPEQDRRWHQAQAADNSASGTDPAPEGDLVSPFAIGGGFLDYCVRQGWLTRQKCGRAVKYYVTQTGRAALAEYGITRYEERLTE
jgi:hypothetical protein